MDVDCLSSLFVKNIVSGFYTYIKCGFELSSKYNSHLQSYGILRGADVYCNADNTVS
jgi:hypothetical protein